ncbi:hypothetical protein SAMN05920897_1073 [Alkalispirochaeta americana]|uniref:O-Antigen ligase n=2 Tax=Alkalispirochaeta americana TaxID=159291 RepID=A0A1N6RSR1_9SPIO|nr:hypothetical protein SAMN05920897_1073 [Alkalispirochaeta americana]
MLEVLSISMINEKSNSIMNRNYRLPQRVLLTGRVALRFQRDVLPWLLFFMGFVAMTPILHAIGWRGVYSVAFVLAITLGFMYIERLELHPWFIYLTLSIVCLSSISAVYWQDPRYIASSVFLIVATFLIQFADTASVERTISIASKFMLLVLILSCFGFLLSLFGVPPLTSFPNPDGRPNFVFYTTFSNSYIGGLVIRPAGIYDEPGALSLYVCAIACLRQLLNRDNRLTWILLVLGFVTFSLAHLIYVVAHLFSERLDRTNRRRLILGTLLIVVVLLSTNLSAIFDQALFMRLQLSETGTVEGDNRSWRMINAYELSRDEPHVALFGADPVCRFDYDECKRIFPPMGENPLSPLVFNGFLLSWPYYLSLLFFLSSPVFGKKYLASFGFGLLLLQRPGIEGITKSVLASIVVFAVVSEIFRSSSHRIILRYLLKNVFVERKE